MITIDESGGIGVIEVHCDRTEPPSSSGSDPEHDPSLGFLPLLTPFEPIGLETMDQVALLARNDTKYVMRAGQLRSVLNGLAEHYRVLVVQGNRLARYRTLYFDTGDFELYRNHHSGKRVRYKVRSREYVDTSQTFLEVKWKAKRERTVKDRVLTPRFVTRWVPDTAGLMELKLLGKALSLEPQVSNEFYRITLVNKELKERVTLDLGLRFQGGGRTVALPGIAVVEVKQEGVTRDSAFVRQMRTAGIRPNGFSKYCIGVSMLYQDVKHNRFKPKLRMVGKLMGGDQDA